MTAARLFHPHKPDISYYLMMDLLFSSNLSPHSRAFLQIAQIVLASWVWYKVKCSPWTLQWCLPRAMLYRGLLEGVSSFSEGAYSERALSVISVVLIGVLATINVAETYLGRALFCQQEDVGDERTREVEGAKATQHSTRTEPRLSR